MQEQGNPKLAQQRSMCTTPETKLTGRDQMITVPQRINTSDAKTNYVDGFRARECNHQHRVY